MTRYRRNADVVILPSEKATGYPQVEKVREKLAIVPNGIKLERLQKTLFPAEKQVLMRKYGLTAGKVLVIVSRLSREKNILFLLKAFPLILRKDPAVKQLIVGDGPQRSTLEKYCDNNGLSESVCFTGNIPYDEVYRYYSLGDVFISASSFENMPLTYLEAMACGLPLLCKRDACLKGILKNGYNGIVFRNMCEFAEGAERLLNDAELNEGMRKHSLKISERFSAENNAKLTIEVCKQVIQRRS